MINNLKNVLKNYTNIPFITTVSILATKQHFPTHHIYIYTHPTSRFSKAAQLARQDYRIQVKVSTA